MTDGARPTQESYQFLLKEHDQLWAEIRHMYGYLGKVYALYVAALGAILAATITLLSQAGRQAGVGGPLLVSPVQLPAFFVVPSTLLLVVLSATLLLHILKFRLVAIEYTTAMNSIRRAFHDHDEAVRPYLELPKQPFTGRKWWNADFFSYASATFLSALLTGSLGGYLSLRLDAPASCSSLVAASLLIAWSGLWICLWRCKVPS
jgi:hypothetical protein